MFVLFSSLTTTYRGLCFALLPLKEEKQLDFSYSNMLYEVEEVEENNPIVMYIEDDIEYGIAAQYFSNLL